MRSELGRTRPARGGGRRRTRPARGGGGLPRPWRDGSDPIPSASPAPGGTGLPREGRKPVPPGAGDASSVGFLRTQKSERLPVRDAPPQRPSRVSDPLTGTPLRGESGPKENSICPRFSSKNAEISKKIEDFLRYNFLREKTNRSLPL